MGSWNKTCGLSRLHILSGTPVHVFVIEQNQHVDRCYATSFWKPLLMPFYSEYNDYGGGENDSGIGLPLIIEALQRELIELPLGENKYHDIAVSRDTFDIKMFYESVHENRLFINNRWSASKKTPIDFVMMRTDIVEDVLENWVRRKYVGAGIGNTGHDNCYVDIKFSDILEDVQEYVYTLASIYEERESMSDLIHLQDSKFSEVSGNEHNHVFKMLRSNDPHLCTIFCPKDLIIYSISNGNVDYATDLLNEHIKAIYISYLMDYNRNLWMPGCHEGSQSQEDSGYIAMTNAIQRAIKTEQDSQDD